MLKKKLQKASLQLTQKISFFRSQMIQVYTINQNDTSLTVIPKNIMRIVCLSVTHIGAMCLLDEREKIVGVSSTDYIYDSILFALKPTSVGDPNMLQIEKLVSLKPDLVILFEIGTSMKNITDKLDKLSIKYIFNSDYKETTPLAQAEWIKFFGAIVDKNEVADSIFQAVERNYVSTKSKVEFKDIKPRVLINLPFKGTWYISSRNSIIGQMIHDAGGTYVFDDEDINGTIPMTFEKVYSKGKNADIWLNPSMANTKNEMLFTCPNSKLFDAYPTDRIFNNTLKSNARGGNDYWESGIYRPDLILEDLRNIFYSRNTNLHYYKNIK
jgi:iron complex transport system substrate-binding protein